MNIFMTVYNMYIYACRITARVWLESPPPTMDPRYCALDVGLCTVKRYRGPYVL